MSSKAWLYVESITSPVLEDSDVAHLSKVRRIRPGELVTLCDGRGSYAEFSVSAISSRQGVLELDPVSPVGYTPEPSYRVGVALHLPKLDRLSWAVQKLAEIGVDDIYLISAKHDRRGGNEPSFDRMLRVAREASQQSRRMRPAVVHRPTTLAEYPFISSPGVAVCRPDGRSPQVRDRVLIIGPESGALDSDDYYDSVRLPGAILRVETASVVAGALLVALRDGLVSENVD